MSPIAWIMSVPQFVLAILVGVYSLRAHRAAQDIMVEHPKSAGRLGNFAQGVLLLSMAYILIQIYWALSQGFDYRPTTADVLCTIWELIVLVHMLLWSITSYETSRDKLIPTTPCRPCPWRGEGDERVLPGGCCAKTRDND